MYRHRTFKKALVEFAPPDGTDMLSGSRTNIVEYIPSSGIDVAVGGAASTKISNSSRKLAKMLMAET